MASLMSMLTRSAKASEPAKPSTPQRSRIMPPRRDDRAAVTRETALSLSTVYRAVQVHATAVQQMPITVERGGERITRVPSIVTTPSLDMTRSAFLEETCNAMYLDGNAFWLKTLGPSDEVLELTPQDPQKVNVWKTRDGALRYGIGNKTYTRREVSHLKLLRVPGALRGLGPIQAARVEVSGALDARNYGSSWFTESGMPSGLLTSDQVLSGDDMKTAKRVWNGLTKDGEPDPDANLAHGVRVLGKGMNYTPLMLKPADVQFLESQKFTTTQLARLMGAPASLLMVSVEGNSRTYANVEQEWLGYVRFTLMKPLREIEEALTACLVRGQTARFNVEALLRTDTKSRYEAHNLALAAKWRTRDEVRAIEDLPPLTPEQRADIDAASPAAPAPAEEPTNA